MSRSIGDMSNMDALARESDMPPDIRGSNQPEADRYLLSPTRDLGEEVERM